VRRFLRRLGDSDFVCPVCLGWSSWSHDFSCTWCGRSLKIKVDLDISLDTPDGMVCLVRKTWSQSHGSTGEYSVMWF
jgi:hypothetical protein